MMRLKKLDSPKQNRRRYGLFKNPLRKRAARLRRRGAVTVEFALTASLFFLLIMASFEFTRLVFARQTLDQAAYEACRIAIVPGTSADTAKTAASDFLSRAGINRSTVTTTPAVIDSSTQSVTVTVQADFSQNSWLTPVFARSLVLRSDVTLDHENLSVLLQNP